MVRVVEGSGGGAWWEPTLAHWRVQACVRDLGITLDPAWSDDDVSRVSEAVGQASSWLCSKGCLETAELNEWIVIDGMHPRRDEDLHRTAPRCRSDRSRRCRDRPAGWHPRARPRRWVVVRGHGRRTRGAASSALTQPGCITEPAGRLQRMAQMGGDLRRCVSARRWLHLRRRSNRVRSSWSGALLGQRPQRSPMRRHRPRPRKAASRTAASPTTRDRSVVETRLRRRSLRLCQQERVAVVFRSVSVAAQSLALVGCSSKGDAEV